jgi:hypothetical protein
VKKIRTVTIRWLYRGAKHGLNLGKDKIVMPMCFQCGARPPKAVSFIVIDITPYCHSCLDRHLGETKEPKSLGEGNDSHSKTTRSPGASMTSNRRPEDTVNIRGSGRT